MGPLATLALVDFGIQWAVWSVSSIFTTERFYDLTGSLTFLLVTYLGLRLGGGGRGGGSSIGILDSSVRQLVTSGLVMTWATRLGSFLFLRVLRAGEDVRFQRVKCEPTTFFVWWTIQGLWVFVTLLPTLLLLLKRDSRPLGPRDILGWTLWVIGFVVEVTADRQKSAFKSDPENAGKFISSGLWSVSRHPNYFGEMTCWAGLWLSASSTFSGLEYLSVLSPAFVAFLIAKVSGIPILERTAEKRWGHDPAYVAYRDNTALLVPFLW